MTENQHSACVRLWTHKLALAGELEQLVEVVEETFGVLWARSQRTLGDATLAAIIDRVVVNTASRAPAFGAIRVDLGGVRCDELIDELRTASATRDDVIATASTMLEEFLERLGRLTGETLTPALHDELATMEIDVERVSGETELDEHSAPTGVRPGHGPPLRSAGVELKAT